MGTTEPPPPRRARRDRYEITEAAPDAYAAWHGNIAAVHRALHAPTADGPSLRRLRSRIYRRVSVEPLTPVEVCRLIPTCHPLYDGVDAELLLLIDDHFAHGNLRHWAAFTRTAAELCAAAGADRVDESVARNAFTLHGAGEGGGCTVALGARSR